MANVKEVSDVLAVAGRKGHRRGVRKAGPPEPVRCGVGQDSVLIFQPKEKVLYGDFIAVDLLGDATAPSTRRPDSLSRC